MNKMLKKNRTVTVNLRIATRVKLKRKIKYQKRETVVRTLVRVVTNLVRVAQAIVLLNKKRSRKS